MNKEKFIQIMLTPEGQYLALTSDGRLFRAYEISVDDANWEEIKTPDLTKVQKRMTKKTL